LERLSAFALLSNVDHLTNLYASRRTVDAETINKNVTVDNHLASLSDCASETCTQN
jgi:hypothetical protein